MISEDYMVVVDGKLKFLPSVMARYLMEKYYFVTLTDTKEVLYYNEVKRRWMQGGEVMIDKIVKADLGDQYKSGDSEEVRKNIMASTYIDRIVLNHHEDLLNVENGVLNTTTLELLPSSKEYYFTYILPVFFDPNMYPEEIMKHLNKIFVDDQNKMIYFLEFCGYILRSGHPIKKALILLGKKNTAKTTTMSILTSMLKDTASNVPLQELCNDRFSSADLEGKLANICDELPKMRIESLDKFKGITGNSPVRANVKFKSAHTFYNRSKQIYGTNTLPTIHDMEDLAFFSRLVIIEFVKEFNIEERDPQISAKLTTPKELSGMLNLMLMFNYTVKKKGYLEHEHDIPVEKNIEWYLNYTESKNEKEFVENCTKDGLGFVTKDQIRNAYLEFCENHGYNTKEAAALTKVLKTMRKVTEGRSSEPGRAMGWRGLILINDNGPEATKFHKNENSYKVLQNYIFKHFSLKEFENVMDVNPFLPLLSVQKIFLDNNNRHIAMTFFHETPQNNGFNQEMPKNNGFNQEMPKNTFHKNETSNQLKSVEIYCPECYPKVGGSARMCYEYNGKWMCIDCMNQKQHEEVME